MNESNDTVLLVMDMQQGILQSYPAAAEIIPNAARAIGYARSKKIPVIYIVVGFRHGAPEISTNNKSFAASRERFENADPATWMKVVDALAPHEHEITCVKRRISAFKGSDLEVVLSAYGARHLVLCGCSTSGVVLSTTREAADKDYRLTILSDCCYDTDAEVHRVLTTKIFPRQAEVTTVDEWTKN